jgi:hypothetical protein
MLLTGFGSSIVNRPHRVKRATCRRRLLYDNRLSRILTLAHHVTAHPKYSIVTSRISPPCLFLTTSYHPPPGHPPTSPTLTQHCRHRNVITPRHPVAPSVPPPPRQLTLLKKITPCTCCARPHLIRPGRVGGPVWPSNGARLRVPCALIRRRRRTSLPARRRRRPRPRKRNVSPPQHSLFLLVFPPPWMHINKGPAAATTTSEKMKRSPGAHTVL